MLYKVLIVDDEKWIRLGLIGMIAQPCELELLEAADAESAFRLFLSARPDIVVSDVRLPGEDGCALCERIYKEDPNAQIIMVSGYSEFEYVRRALAYRAVDYLLKPVEADALNQAISRCLGELGAPGSGPERESGSTQDIIACAVRHIGEHYGAKLTLGELAGSYYVSEAYFSSLFKKTVGIPLVQYITEVRIGHAKELLTDTECKIHEIAERVGYPDQNYFTKVFKKATGLNPTDYKLREDAGDAQDG